MGDTVKMANMANKLKNELQGCGKHPYNELCYMCRTIRDNILLERKNGHLVKSTTTALKRHYMSADKKTQKRIKQYVQTRIMKYFLKK